MVSSIDETGIESLLFRAGASVCALPLTSVVETMRPLPIQPLAGSSVSAAVLGVAIVRGVALPVVDVGRLLHAGGEGRAARFVVVRVDERGVALAVDEVIGIRSLRANLVHDLPPLLRGAHGDVVEAIGALDRELLIVLRAARLLPPRRPPTRLRPPPPPGDAE